MTPDQLPHKLCPNFEVLNYSKYLSDMFSEKYNAETEIINKLSDRYIKKKNEIIRRDSEDYKKNKASVLKIIDYIELHKIDITARHENWIRIAAALGNEFNEEGLGYFHRVSRFYHGYTKKECDSTYQYFLHTTHDKPATIKTFFYIAKQFITK
jgi:hypothetical protein